MHKSRTTWLSLPPEKEAINLSILVDSKAFFPSDSAKSKGIISKLSQSCFTTAIFFLLDFSSLLAIASKSNLLAAALSYVLFTFVYSV